MGDTPNNLTRNEYSSIYLTQNISHHTNNSSIQIEKQVQDYPSISMKLIDEAINQQLLPEDMREKLIRNPNKCSIFFAKFDCDSPTTRDAMKRLNLTSENIELKKYSQILDPQKDALANLIKYLFYVTQQYKILKELVSLKLKIKQENANNTLNFSMKSSSEFRNNTSIFTSPKHFSTASTRSIDFKFMPLDEQIQMIKERNENHQKIFEQSLMNQQRLIQQRRQKIEEMNLKSQKAIEKIKKKQETQHLEISQQNQEKMEQVYQRIRYNQEKRETQLENKFKKLNINNHNDFSQDQRVLNSSQSDSNLLNNNRFSQKFNMKLEKIQNFKKEIDQHESEQRDQMLVQRESKVEHANFKHQMNVVEIQKKCQFHNEQVERARERYFDQYQTAEDEIINKYCRKEENLILQLQKKEEALNKQLKERLTEEQKKEATFQQITDMHQRKLEDGLEKLQEKIKQTENRRLKVQQEMMMQVQQKMEQERIHRNEIKINYVQQILKQNEKNDRIIEKHKSINSRIDAYKNDSIHLIEASRSLHFENKQKRNSVLESFMM